MFSGTMTVWTVWTDCMCVDVYFHERWAKGRHDFWYMSSNILDRVHAIFGSRFEWNFAPSAQLRHGLGIAEGGIGENPSGLFLATSFVVDWIRGNCFSVPPGFLKRFVWEPSAPSSHFFTLVRGYFRLLIQTQRYSSGHKYSQSRILWGRSISPSKLIRVHLLLGRSF